MKTLNALPTKISTLFFIALFCSFFFIPSLQAQEQTIRPVQEEEITISNNKSVKESDYISRMPLHNIENPQTYTLIPKETLQQQAAVSFEEGMKNAAGVQKIWPALGRGDFGAAYFSIRGFSIQPTMRDGVAGITNAPIDISNIERIEIIRGPSATLFGSTLINYGGLINIVSKKPEAHSFFKITTAQYFYHPYSGALTPPALNNRSTLDVNTPISKSQKLLFRLNATFGDNYGFRDAGNNRHFFIAPALSITNHKNLNIDFNASFYKGALSPDAPLMLSWTRPYKAQKPQDIPVDLYRFSFTNANIRLRNHNINIFNRTSYQLSKVWQLQNNIAYSFAQTEGYYPQITLQNNQNIIERRITPQQSYNQSLHLQQNAIGQYNRGNISNKWVIGVELLLLRRKANHTSTINPQPAYAIDQLDLYRLDPNAYYQNFTPQNIQKIIDTSAKVPLIAETAQTQTYGAYISDVLSLGKRFSLMLSLRLDYFNNQGLNNIRSGQNTSAYKQLFLAPKLGLSYQILPETLSFFTNYMNGFKNKAPQTQPNGEVSYFKPEQANQIEGGFKLETLQKHLAVTLSYYHISVTDKVRTDFSDGRSYQDGSLLNQGVELDIALYLWKGLSCMGGYAFNHSKNLSGDANIKDRRYVEAGPAHMAHLWIYYTLPQGLKGLSMGLGGNYGSENLVGNFKFPGVFTLPAYLIFDAVLTYAYKNYQFTFKVGNLSNQKYYSGYASVVPNAPRSYLISLSVQL